MTVEKLSQVLWRERELLDALLYRLEVEQLVLASGRTQLLMRAAADVESVLTDLRETEILRAMTADEAAAAIGLGHNPSLRALAEALEEPWQTIMLDHREAFVRLSREITALGDTNRELLAVGLRSARETLLSLHDEGAQGYRPDGAKVLDRPRHQLVDRSL